MTTFSEVEAASATLTCCFLDDRPATVRWRFAVLGLREMCSRCALEVLDTWPAEEFLWQLNGHPELEEVAI